MSKWSIPAVSRARTWAEAWLRGLRMTAGTSELPKSWPPIIGMLSVPVRRASYTAASATSVLPVPVGADGEVLTADSGSPTGLTWATPATVAAASASVVTSESTTTDSFVDLTTPGPAVTVAVGPQGVAVVSVTAITGSSYQEDTDVWFEGQAGFAVTGANTIAASSPKSLGVDVRALTAGGDAWVTSSVRGSATFVLTGLAPGSTTFTMKYRCSDIGGGGGSASFSNRQIGVVTF